MARRYHSAISFIFLLAIQDFPSVSLQAQDRFSNLRFSNIIAAMKLGKTPLSLLSPEPDRCDLRLRLIGFLQVCSCAPQTNLIITLVAVNRVHCDTVNHSVSKMACSSETAVVAVVEAV